MAAERLEETVEQAEFVFRGTVQQLRATTIRELPPDDRTAIVRVEEVIDAPAQFSALAGQRVTVGLRDPTGIQEGQQWIFFATSWLFGESIAVQEIRHEGVEELAEPRTVLSAAQQSSAARKLQDRIARADAVVVGRVAAVRPSETAAEAARPGPGPASEHDPQWWEAVIDVENVIKGELAPQPTVLLFPFSMDVMWRDVPKFHQGQEGVWFLQSEQVPEATAEVFPQAFTALQPDDFQPRERAAELQRLIEDTSR